MAEKKPILKNYCVMYSLELDSVSEDDFWTYRPKDCAISLYDEERSTNINEMFLQSYHTGVIQATSISEAEIKMMEWINRKFLEIDPNIIKGIEYDNWQGFCRFMSIINDEYWEFDTVIEYYGKYFDLNHREILKEAIDDFYNLFYSENKEYENWKSFDFKNQKDNILVRKFNLFTNSEKHFFNIWIHRWRFQLFYLENLITLNK